MVVFLRRTRRVESKNKSRHCTIFGGSQREVTPLRRSNPRGRQEGRVKTEAVSLGGIVAVVLMARSGEFDGYIIPGGYIATAQDQVKISYPGSAECVH